MEKKNKINTEDMHPVGQSGNSVIKHRGDVVTEKLNVTLILCVSVQPNRLLWYTSTAS